MLTCSQRSFCNGDDVPARSLTTLTSLALTMLIGLCDLPALGAEPKAKAKLDISEARGPEGEVGKLSGITLASADLASIKLFYEDGLKLALEGPLELPPGTRDAQRALWMAPAELQWDEYRLTRVGQQDTPSIRVLLLKQSTPSTLSSWNALQEGPFAIGFPNANQAELDARMRKLGFGAQATMQSYPVTRADGLKYQVKETIFNGPDFVKGVGIEREASVPPLAPIDSESGLGGPGYSSLVVRDAEVMLKFFTEVLDWEVRADRVWKTSGALGAPVGTEYRFLILYAKGSTHGHVLMLEFKQVDIQKLVQPPRLPQRGIVLWTMKVADMAQTLQRARAAKHAVIGPKSIDLPGFGPRQVATVEAPNGMLIELISGL
jgi:catechol 2,3-dioxygenase-like lactoylglutathione lyase family enzyme